ncbi:coiled-coil domain-containing protein 174 [Vespa velutina]|uniref:coiled-coil domain-containing protein 174 n=1 Tax=Vespa velutina TaxID=202808 RepID=UPI001FB2D3DB|nr:coiled-coil domain-containing protein 174 [Vespa velutina]
MNVAKKINVNFSSLVGLKAELLRKQTEVKEAKAHIETTQTTKLKRKIKQVKNDHKNSAKELTDVEDINAHKKSKLVLEAKARLYTKLKKSKNSNENFLVDFTNKSDESEEEILKEDDYDDRFVDPDDSWVEYEDCFGRTRKCLAKDLPLMREKDELLKQEITKKHMQQNVFNTEETQIKEPEIDIMRRKWEEQTQKLAEKADIHYQDILFDEARAHGVGYYAFSQDEEERAKQQENLTNLRRDTEQKQKHIKELKDLKEKMEQNRLKAARIRQRIRAGLPAEPEENLQDDSTNTTNISNDINTVNNISSVQENKISRDDLHNQDNNVDKKKTKEQKIKVLEEVLENQRIWREMSQEEWVHKCRKERNLEFAPVYNDKILNSNFVKITQTNNTIVSDQASNQTNSLMFSNISSTNKNTSVNNSSNSINVSKQICPDINDQQNDSLTEQQLLDTNASVPLITYPHIYYRGNDTSVKTSKYNSNPKDNQPSQSINNVLNKTINEEKIAAGLRYLREKYEQSQNH